MDAQVEAVIVCSECGAVLANRNDRVKHLVCSFCLFGNSDLASRREILFPEKEASLV